MEGQQFCLRWHNFQNTLLGTLPKLLDGGYLTDVTLSAGGRHIHAHRIILSACSFYFKELFKDLNTLQHPVIILPGLEYTNLCALVTFMYNGEVNIYQEQLPALLAMADTLHIRGLADITGKSWRYDSRMNETAPTPAEDKEDLADLSIKKETKEPEQPLHRTNSPPDNPDEESSNEAPCSVKTKPYYSINAKLNQREKKPTLPQQQPLELSVPERIKGDFPILEKPSVPPIADVNFKFLAGSVSRMSPGCNKSNVTCLVCGKQLSNQYNLRVHMETHNNSSYSCTACSHVSRSRDALRKHVSYRHPVTASQKRPRFSATKP